MRDMIDRNSMSDAVWPKFGCDSILLSTFGRFWQVVAESFVNGLFDDSAISSRGAIYLFVAVCLPTPWPNTAFSLGAHGS